MCLAVPGRIIERRNDIALVDFQGNRMEVSAVLTPDAGAGEWVLVHAGFAIAPLTEEAARETWSYLTEMYAAAGPETARKAEVTDA